MRFLRTVSTQRLLAMIAGVVVAIAAGTAIAVAAAGGGPVPRREGLATAIHQALAAPSVKGISARITFTNHLIDSSDLQGSDPILQGASGRLWLSTDRRLLRLELQSDNGDAQVVVNNGSFWVYDPSSNTAYEGKLPAQHASSDTNTRRHAAADRLPSVRKIQTQLNDVMRHTTLSTAIPSDVASQPTYTVRVSPKHDGGLLGAAELAWDSVHGVPLRVAVYARGDSSPVLELKATDISYSSVSTSVFNISPPSGAKVVKVSAPGSHAGRLAAAHRRAAHSRKDLSVNGLTAVQRHLSFHLLAPSILVGLPRQSVTLLDWAGTPAALVTYGQHLGGIAVIEQTEKSTAASVSQSSSSGSNGERRGLSLPTVSINGATGQELDTALGTMVRFTRAGVSYTVLGSVPPAAADAAARAL